MHVAFFQRFFAHYQWGLVQELANHSEHSYTFFGDKRDPARTGIEPIPLDRRRRVDYRVVLTWHITPHLAIQPAAIREAFTGKYDAFIFEGAFHHPSTWLAMWVAQARGKRVLLYAHGWKGLDTNPLIRLIRLAFMRQADGLLLYGHRARSIGLSLGVSSAKMYVVYNSLDYQQMTVWRNSINQAQLNALREGLFGNSQLPVVIYVGRLITSKHVDLLVDACSRIISGGQSLGLIVVGDGPELEFLKEKVLYHNIPVHFRGALYDEKELSLLISASNVLVIPAYLGLSAIHAMTYGTPVITHDSIELQGPEVEAIIPGKTGAFFHQNDPDSLANALIPFLSASDSRATYQSNCLAVIDKYYNPAAMRIVFDRAVTGLPSEDALSSLFRY